MKKLLILCFITCFLFSCKTKTVYVPVETVKTEYQDRIHRDSIHVLDSVFMKVEGDSVWLEKYKYVYRDKIIRDSIFKAIAVQVPYPVEILKEVNRLEKWQIILMCIGSAALAGWVLVLIRKFKVF